MSDARIFTPLPRRSPRSSRPWRGRQTPARRAGARRRRRDGAATPSAARTAAASASGAPGGTSQPVTPSSTSSRMPPTAVATTGRAAAIASIAADGSPSNRDGNTKRSARARRAATSVRLPSRWTRSVRPARVTASSSDARSGPSPTRTKCTDGSTMPAAAIRSSRPFCGCRRATVTHTRADAGTPSAERSAGDASVNGARSMPS